LGLLAIPFTLLWLLGAINAINLIDGIDGLASSVGLVLCITFAAIMGWRGETVATIIMLALGGSLLGFLRYNFAPATVFLGDAGSMLIGLLIGTIAIASSTKSAATVALAVPVAVWSVPILDSAAAILRRKLTGRSLFAADRGHLHHSLLVRGWSVRQAVLFIGLISAMTCVSAVLGIYFRNEIVGLLMVIAIVGFLIATETFGHIELALIKDRFRSSGFLLSRRNSDAASYRESRIQLQGARQWDTLWTAIIESADSYQLVRLKLIIHIPGLHEDYFASWNSSRNRRNIEERIWQVSHPLIVDDVVVGHLEIAGVPESTSSTLDHIIQILDFLEPIEEDVSYIMKGIEVDRAAVRIGQTSATGRRRPAELPVDSEAEANSPADTTLTDRPHLDRKSPAAIN
jgi:UDP-GlcNAc:undecaprenyl-phosphate GlcNAc-1-phosphate transferase